MKNLYPYILLLFICTINYRTEAASIKPFFSSPELQKKWFTAAREGNLEMINSLVRQVDVNLHEKETPLSCFILDATALILAACYKHEHIVRYLLTVPGIDVNARSKHGVTALSYAALSGYENIVKSLIQARGINIEAQDQFGRTALNEAVEQKQDNVVKILLSIPGININHQDNDGRSPFIAATCKNSENIVKLLLAMPDININLQDTEGSTALMHSVEFWKNENIVKLLVNAPDINFYIRDKKGKTALMRAQESSLKIAKILQDKITKLTAKAIEAIDNNHIETLKLILNQIGVNNVVGPDGTPIFAKAVASGDLQIYFCIVHHPDYTRAKPIKEQEILPHWRPEEELAIIEEQPLPILPSSPNPHTQQLGQSSDITKTSEILEYACARCSKKNCAHRCSRCKKAFYCSEDCQKADWLNHRTVCN